MDCLHQIYAILVLDNNGKCLFGKYYGASHAESGEIADAAEDGATSIRAALASKWPTPDRQRAFESNIHSRIRAVHSHNSGSSSSEGDVILYDGSTIVFLADPELTFAVVGGPEENELVLSSVLTCLYESLQQLFKTVTCIEQRMLLEKYDVLTIVVDEMIDDGVILEMISANVVAEVLPFVPTENQTVQQANQTLHKLNRFLKEAI